MNRVGMCGIAVDIVDVDVGVGVDGVVGGGIGI